MSILIDKNTRVLVQGLGKAGTAHAKACAAYEGTRIVGAVKPGKGGTVQEGFDLFETVEEAVRKTGADASMIFVPPAGAAEAIMEAADAGTATPACWPLAAAAAWQPRAQPRRGPPAPGRGSACR